MTISPNAATFNHFASIYDVIDMDRTAEIGFYRSVVGEGEPAVLELGAGTGTMLIGMGSTPQGQWLPGRWVGVDGAADMLEVARQKAPHMEWVLGDIRKPPLHGPQFDLITCCYNTTQLLLEDGDVEQMLLSAKALLKPGGRFVFDMYQPNLDYLLAQPTQSVIRWFKEMGRELVVHQDASYDSVKKVLCLIWQVRTPEGEIVMPERTMVMHMRQYFATDLERMLEKTGFTMLERYGFYDRRPYQPDSIKQVMICQAK